MTELGAVICPRGIRVPPRSEEWRSTAMKEGKVCGTIIPAIQIVF